MKNKLVAWISQNNGFINFGDKKVIHLCVDEDLQKIEINIKIPEDYHFSEELLTTSNNRKLVFSRVSFNHDIEM